MAGSWVRRAQGVSQGCLEKSDRVIERDTEISYRDELSWLLSQGVPHLPSVSLWNWRSQSGYSVPPKGLRPVSPRGVVPARVKSSDVHRQRVDVPGQEERMNGPSSTFVPFRPSVNWEVPICTRKANFYYFIEHC